MSEKSSSVTSTQPGEPSAILSIGMVTVKTSAPSGDKIVKVKTIILEPGKTLELGSSDCFSKSSKTVILGMWVNPQTGHTTVTVGLYE